MRPGLPPLHGLPPVTPDSAAAGVDLWCFFYQGIRDAALLEAYQGLLTADERERQQRLHFEGDRLMFLATRALVRTALSSYAAVAPQDWRFATGAHGKPYIKEPAGVGPLHFNLTNTAGLVVCAVSRAFPRLGVDAEWTARGGQTVEIADSYFSPTEVAALRALPPALQPERFFHYWTLKESYIKARGLGLALPLEGFSFLLAGGDIRIAFDDQLGDDARAWRFALLAASPVHPLAVGADTGGARLPIAACNVVPLQGPVPFLADPP